MSGKQTVSKQDDGATQDTEIKEATDAIHAITSDRKNPFTRTLLKQVVTVSHLQQKSDHLEFSERKVWQLHDGSWVFLRCGSHPGVHANGQRPLRNFSVHLRKVDRLSAQRNGMYVKILELYGVLVGYCDNDWAVEHNRRVDEIPTSDFVRGLEFGQYCWVRRTRHAVLLPVLPWEELSHCPERPSPIVGTIYDTALAKSIPSCYVRNSESGRVSGLEPEFSLGRTRAGNRLMAVVEIRDPFLGTPKWRHGNIFLEDQPAEAFAWVKAKDITYRKR
ncbi:hypothetical protein PspLS_07705 [Pyricularia sp. CBS 133598]|nr:hypothetical protein PspLS_07705 [Pyricularia sp. CBS 133598]